MTMNNVLNILRGGGGLFYNSTDSYIHFLMHGLSCDVTFVYDIAIAELKLYGPRREKICLRG